MMSCCLCLAILVATTVATATEDSTNTTGEATFFITTTTSTIISGTDTKDCTMSPSKVGCRNNVYCWNSTHLTAESPTPTSEEACKTFCLRNEKARWFSFSSEINDCMCYQKLEECASSLDTWYKYRYTTCPLKTCTTTTTTTAGLCFNGNCDAREVAWPKSNNGEFPAENLDECKDKCKNLLEEFWGNSIGVLKGVSKEYDPWFAFSQENKCMCYKKCVPQFSSKQDYKTRNQVNCENANCTCPILWNWKGLTSTERGLCFNGNCDAREVAWPKSNNAEFPAENSEECKGMCKNLLEEFSEEVLLRRHILRQVKERPWLSDPLSSEHVSDLSYSEEDPWFAFSQENKCMCYKKCVLQFPSAGYKTCPLKSSNCKKDATCDSITHVDQDHSRTSEECKAFCKKNRGARWFAFSKKANNGKGHCNCYKGECHTLELEEGYSTCPLETSTGDSKKILSSAGNAKKKHVIQAEVSGGCGNQPKDKIAAFFRWLATFSFILTSSLY